MRNPPLPPLPSSEEPPRRQRITQRLWTDWADETHSTADTVPEAPYVPHVPHAPYAPYADEAPRRSVLTRPIRWDDELDAPTVTSARISSPLISGPLGPLPGAQFAAPPRRRIKQNEWMLLIGSVGIVVILVLVTTIFGFLRLAPPSSSDAQSNAGAPVAPAPPPTATLAPTPTVTPLPAVESSFVSQDVTTQGNWPSRYGSQGYMIVGDTQQLPASVQVTPANQQEAIWQSSTSDPRALQKATDPTDHTAACWYSSGNFTIDVNVTDGQTYQLALYFVDWDQQNRAEILNVLDPATDAVLDTRSITTFANGEYLVWNVRGHVTFQITNAPGSANAVVSGLFIAPAAGAPGSTPGTTPAATPVTSPTDTSTPALSTPTPGPDAIPTDTPAP